MCLGACLTPTELLLPDLSAVVQLMFALREAQEQAREAARAR